ncbi:MAG: pyridoxamine 5'-phosphate oxidase family protein [Anaerolineae bacterium]|nr:pyridoxamine 5'-phosphate oxidase family protein [Anaerolineae bacterium]
MEVNNFAEIAAEFSARVRKVVWCNMATVDPLGRPRSRVLHPIWEGVIGWIGTSVGSYKGHHLRQNPYVSLAYIADITRPVYVDCLAEWIEDPAQRQYVWDLFEHTPEPIGYDPAPFFGTLETFGVLKLTPWRIDLVSFPAPSLQEGSQIWHNPEVTAPVPA